jgi:fructosamine-3-kinase
MESGTKNKQSRETIEKMVVRAFPNRNINEIKELTEGFFNIAYLIELSDNMEVILKIAPAVNSLIMTYEKNIMFSEVNSMRMIRKETKVPVPDILYYDNSHSICESDYFFMSKIPGQSFNASMESIDDEVKKQVNFRMGKYNADLNQIAGHKFGYYGQEEKQGMNWHEVFKSMVMDTIQDAKALDIDQQIAPNIIFELLDKDRNYFEEVVTPKFVHWDIWAGNVFVENNTITGIIDFERCLWGDELLEFGFRSFGYNEDFFKGYGINELTESQKIRIKWYDIYFFLLVSLECDYRQYETRDAYNWATSMLKDLIQEVQGRNDNTTVI